MGYTHKTASELMALKESFDKHYSSLPDDVREYVRSLLTLVEETDEPCRFDHHGFCQNHMDFNISDPSDPDDVGSPLCWAVEAELLTQDNIVI